MGWPEAEGLIMARINEQQVARMIARCSVSGALRVVAEGRKNAWMFSSDALVAVGSELEGVLQELHPSVFDDQVGAAISSLQLDADGEVWGDELVAQGLHALAMATGRGGFIEVQAAPGQTQREAWDGLPGGEPSVWIRVTP